MDKKIGLFTTDNVPETFVSGQYKTVFRGEYFRKYVFYLCNTLSYFPEVGLCCFLPVCVPVYSPYQLLNA
jgi:hypothetical protein